MDVDATVEEKPEPGPNAYDAGQVLKDTYWPQGAKLSDKN